MGLLQGKTGEIKENIIAPKSSQITVCNKKEAKRYYEMSKAILEKFGHLELLSIDRSTVAINIAEYLEENKLAFTKKTYSDTIEINDSKEENGKRIISTFKMILARHEEANK